MAERLEHIRKQHGLSRRAFWSRAMQGVPLKSQVTYPSTLTYHTDRDATAVYLGHVSRAFGVRMEWLTFGDGPMTKEEEQRELADRFFNAGSLQSHDVDRAFAYLPEEERRKHFDKRAALARYSDKLADVISAPFMEMEARTDVLQCALRFLIGVEEMFDRFEDPNPDNPETRLAFKGSRADLYLMRSASSGWRVTWQDAVLDLYSRRVKGLGERSEEFWDQHHPAAGRPPLSEPEDYRM